MRPSGRNLALASQGCSRASLSRVPARPALAIVAMRRRSPHTNRMGIENPIHLLFLGAVALLVIGPKRLPDMARALGKGMREFREAMSGEGEGDDDPARGHHEGSDSSRG